MKLSAVQSFYTIVRFLSVGFLGMAFVQPAFATEDPDDGDIPFYDSDIDMSESSLKYHFQEISAPKDGKPARSCDTGPQEFHSIEDFCIALRNEELNRGCAKVDRERKFTETHCEKLAVFELGNGGEAAPKKRKHSK